MTRFNLPEDAADRVAFTYSPAWEAAVSLRVLARPRRHPLHHLWALKLAKVPAALKRRVKELEFSLTPGFLLPTAAGRGRAFDAEMDLLQRLDPALARDEFVFHLRIFSGEPFATILEQPPPEGELLATIAQQDGVVLPAARTALEDPRALLASYVELLSEYWHTFFESDWSGIEPRIADATRQGEKDVRSRGLYGCLEDLSRYLHVDVGSQQLDVLVQEFQDHQHEITPSAESPLGLVPSVYAWPQVCVNCDPPWAVGITFPAPFIEEEARQRTPPDDLQKALRAVGDETRIKILRLVAEAPRTTQEISRLVRASQATVSRHLQILREGGLVEGQRHGYYVFYRFVPAGLARFSQQLKDFLQM